jgi:hypothetical protein
MPGPSHRFSHQDAINPRGIEITNIHRPSPATASAFFRMLATKAILQTSSEAPSPTRMPSRRAAERKAV